jgi:FAD:protein FMN transferase
LRGISALRSFCPPALCLASALLGTLPAPGHPDQPSTSEFVKIEREEEAMGSSFALVLYGRDRAALEAAADAAFDEAHRLDRLLSNYRPESEWSLVNRDAGTRPVVVSPELFALLQSCLEYSRQSQGAFDISVGPLVRTWGFFKGEGRFPPHSNVRSALRRVGYRHVELNATARTVRFTRPGVELDPGGIGKGYAVDRMAAILARAGVQRALVSAAGSSIYGAGAPPDEPRGWVISIRAPRSAEAIAAQIYLKDQSLSTSGSDEKFFFAKGRRWAHIIDPRTGYPAQGVDSVSVFADRAIDSEAWTKPFFINGRAWTAAHKPAGLRVFFCAEAPGACEWM